jgi:hypothetical protein
MYMLNTVGTAQILTEGTVEELGKVSLNGIYTESDCDLAEGVFVLLRFAQSCFCICMCYIMIGLLASSFSVTQRHLLTSLMYFHVNPLG